MVELDVAKLINDKVLEFGNERFVEGWEGAREYIADELRNRAADLIADGDMASAELVLLGKLIDWLEKENK